MRKRHTTLSAMVATFYKNRAIVFLLFASLIVAINQSRVLLFDYNLCYLTSCLHQLCVCKEDTGCAPFKGDRGYAVHIYILFSERFRGLRGEGVRNTSHSKERLLCQDKGVAVIVEQR